MAVKAGVKLALTNPCFELWAITLHSDQRAYLHRHEAQRILRTYMEAIIMRKIHISMSILVKAGLKQAEQRCAN